MGSSAARPAAERRRRRGGGCQPVAGAVFEEGAGGFVGLEQPLDVPPDGGVEPGQEGRALLRRLIEDGLEKRVDLAATGRDR